MCFNWFWKLGAWAWEGAAWCGCGLHLLVGLVSELVSELVSGQQTVPWVDGCRYFTWDHGVYGTPRASCPFRQPMVYAPHHLCRNMPSMPYPACNCDMSMHSISQEQVTYDALFLKRVIYSY